MNLNINLELQESNLQNEELLLLKSAESASSQAINSSISKGLTVTILENHMIVEVSNKGRKTIRKKKKMKDYDFSKLKKGMVLERK